MIGRAFDLVEKRDVGEDVQLSGDGITALGFTGLVGDFFGRQIFHIAHAEGVLLFLCQLRHDDHQSFFATIASKLLAGGGNTGDEHPRSCVRAPDVPTASDPAICCQSH